MAEEEEPRAAVPLRDTPAPDEFKITIQVRAEVRLHGGASVDGD